MNTLSEMMSQLINAVISFAINNAILCYDLLKSHFTAGVSGRVVITVTELTTALTGQGIESRNCFIIILLLQ